MRYDTVYKWWDIGSVNNWCHRKLNKLLNQLSLGHVLKESMGIKYSYDNLIN